MHLNVAAAILWTAAGLVGFVVRLALYMKFRGDLAATRKLLDGFSRSIANRQVQSTIMHLYLKIGVVVVGVVALFQTAPPASAQPTIFGAIVTIFLVSIPVYLTFDAVQEYRHQWTMLRYAEHVEATRLGQEVKGTAQDVRQVQQDARQKTQDAADTRATAEGARQDLRDMTQDMREASLNIVEIQTQNEDEKGKGKS